ncbi:MAG: hypothetical protein Q9164_004904 [Protoblastenia rupestris]
MVLQAIKYERGKLEILDQLRLPHEEVYTTIQSPQDGWNAIKSMQVRGAPAIAIVAALSLAVWLVLQDTDDYPLGGLSANAPAADVISQCLKFLVTSRPTAVNLLDAAKKLEKVAYDAQAKNSSNRSSVYDAYLAAAEKMLVDDVQDNESIGRHGAQWIENVGDISLKGNKISVITHCNTGSLATAGYGTALGVIWSLHARGSLSHVFYTETRPYNQGARLTGYELIHADVPATLITDSMSAALLQTRKDSDRISCVIVGADRVAANGDTANKIGTYNLAILAKYHGIKFLVAAPRTTIDLTTASGKDIPIEQRPMREVTALKGAEVIRSKGGSESRGPVREISLASMATQAWNPSFDVTPAELIDGIITEKGVVEKHADGLFHFEHIFEKESDRDQKPLQEADESQLTNGQDPQSRAAPMNWVGIQSIKADQVKPWTEWMEEINKTDPKKR